MKKSERINSFVTELWSWYERHKRVLPWRDLSDTDDTERAYKILVSEIMLQQTQVSRVIIIFRNFLNRFPTIHDLAKASNKDVILAWKGMGYNSRALRLRDAARSVVETHKGVFPKELPELLAIKGIGPYTAAAIRNFAFNLPAAGIDTNIRRVLHRVFIGPENSDGTFETSDKELIPLCSEILDAWISAGHAPRDFFAALMDFGSMVQTKSNPKWEICPLTEKGIMKTTARSFERRDKACLVPTEKQIEPGRMVGARFIPNRIFRGRIVDALRENEDGLTLDQVGNTICIDWTIDHKPWLKKLITKLIQDRLIAQKKSKFMLAE